MTSNAGSDQRLLCEIWFIACVFIFTNDFDLFVGIMLLCYLSTSVIYNMNLTQKLNLNIYECCLCFTTCFHAI